MNGVVSLAPDGCLLLDAGGTKRLAVWLRSATQATDDGGVVLLPDGRRINPGDRVIASAAVLPVAKLASWPDGHWGTNVTSCVPRAPHVVILDSVMVPAKRSPPSASTSPTTAQGHTKVGPARIGASGSMPGSSASSWSAQAVRPAMSIPYGGAVA